MQILRKESSVQWWGWALIGVGVLAALVVATEGSSLRRYAKIHMM
jgi:hypothetical protein